MPQHVIELLPGCVEYDLPESPAIQHVDMHDERQNGYIQTVPLVAAEQFDAAKYAMFSGLFACVRGGKLLLSRAPEPGEQCLTVRYSRASSPVSASLRRVPKYI